MTSSTTASDPWARPPARVWAACVAAALVTLAVCAGAVRGLAAQVVNPRAGQAVERIGAGAPWIVLGNSVAQSAVDPVGLARGVGASEAALATIDGALGPHVAALVRHHPPAAGTTLVVFMPEHNLLAGRLPTEMDRSLLIELLAGPDAPLTDLALGGAVTWGDLAWRDRERARLALLDGVAATPVRVASRLAGIPAQVGDTLAALGAEAGPVAAPSGSLPGGASRTAVEAELVAPSDSALPLLIEGAADARARLVVVLPFERSADGAPCRRTPTDGAAAWLVGRGVAVVDLRGAPLPGGAFNREHHLHAGARAAATDVLAEALRAAAPGAYWHAACAR